MWRNKKFKFTCFNVLFPNRKWWTKEFCLKLKDSFRYEKAIRYEIKSSTEPFSVKLKIKNIIYDIATDYINNTEEEIERVLNDIYKKLDEQE